MKATGRCVQYSSPHGNGHQNGQQSGYMLHHYCVDYCPGGCQGNTEQVVTQWWHPVTSGEALVMLLHQVMRSRLHRRTTMAIEMACNGGAFIRRRPNRSSAPCYGPLTLIAS
jgi:hypothetical protein